MAWVCEAVHTIRHSGEPYTASALVDDSSGDCRSLGEADARDKEASERKQIKNRGGSLAHTRTIGAVK